MGPTFEDCLGPAPGREKLAAVNAEREAVGGARGEKASGRIAADDD